MKPQYIEVEPEEVIGDCTDVPDCGGIIFSTTGPELIKRLLEE